MPWTRKINTTSTVPGPKGDKGDPGVNAVENVTAVTAYVASENTSLWDALRARFSRRRAFDPRDYGAVGNGAADDTAAVQACINAAGAGGVVELPSLTFKISAPLIIPTGLEIRGSGARGSVLFANSDITMISITGGQAQAVRNLCVRNWFVGDRTTYDIDIVNPTKTVLSDVEVDLATGTRLKGGIRFRKDAGVAGNTFMPQLSRVWVRNGHLIVDGVTDGHAVDCFIWAVNTGARAAIDMSNISNGWTFQAVDVIPSEGSGSGYRLEQTWDTNINGGYIDGSYTDQDSGYGVRVINGGQLFMSATRFYHLGRSAILMEGSSGSSFSALGFARNNKQDNSYPDIDLVNSSYNTFIGMAHSQRSVRTNKGIVYREDATSLSNKYDSNTVDLTAGNNYGTPWFQGNSGTLGASNRPGSLWPRPSSTPLVLIPQGCMLGSGAVLAWPAANRAQFHRFHVSEGGVYRYTGFRVETAGGNIQAAIVRMDGVNFTRVAVSPTTAASTVGNISLDMGATYLAPGEYALALWADNATLALAQVNGEMVRATRLCAEVTGLTTGIPASGSISAWSTTRAVSGLTLTASA